MSFALAAKILLWIAAGVAAFVRPSLGDSLFAKIEALASRLARHRTASWLSAGLLVLLVRGALLPVWPIPKPAIFDEFAYVLQADTFSHGRLTNPPHKLWPFFESAYVLQRPTYQSKYPPSQGLAMAFGQVLFGDSWFGVWLSCGAMAAAFVWALQGWLPPRWALFGGLLAMPLSLTSYWMNSYWGGAVAAVGGALVLGGYARVVKQDRPLYALAVGAGLAILANARPYEGLVFSIPVAIAFFRSRPRLKSVACVAAVLISACAFTATYNKAVTGHALLLPYNEYSRQYAVIPLFNVQPLQPAKVLRTPSMSDLQLNWEPEQWRKARSWQLIPLRLNDWKFVITGFLGSLLAGLPLLLFFPNLWRDRRIRLPLVCLAAALAGSIIEVLYYQHYAAPAAAALMIVAVESYRHLRHWKPGGGPMGLFLTRAIPLLVIGTAVVSQAALLIHPGPQPKNTIRDQVAASVRDLVNQHVILVHYSGHQSPHEEWVYNGADIDSQDVIWAHDLDDNAPLLEYYKDRKIWLYQPDTNPDQAEPYR